MRHRPVIHGRDDSFAALNVFVNRYTSGLACALKLKSALDDPDELVLIEGLMNGKVSPGLEGLGDQFWIVRAGEHDNGETLQPRAGPEPTGYLKPVEIRHHYVKQDDRGTLTLGDLQSGRPVFRGHCGETSAGEESLDDLAENRVVIDVKHERARGFGRFLSDFGRSFSRWTSTNLAPDLGFSPNPSPGIGVCSLRLRTDRRVLTIPTLAPSTTRPYYE